MSDEPYRGLDKTPVNCLRAIARDDWGISETTSVSSVADRLEASERTAARMVDRLVERDYVEKNSDAVQLTDDGKRFLWKEYADYSNLVTEQRQLLFRGSVTSGLGKGKHFVSLSGYQTQFTAKLGYEPYPGTLNVKLTPPSIRSRLGLEECDSIRIEPWSAEGETYGAADCYPVTLHIPSGIVDRCHAIVPVRTDHDADELELLAPVEIRAEFDLEDGDSVTVEVECERP